VVVAAVDWLNEEEMKSPPPQICSGLQRPER